MSEKAPFTGRDDSDLLELPDSNVSQGEESPFSIDYRRLWAVTRKFSWLIVLYLIAGTVGAMVYLSNSIPIYRSFARLKIEQRVMDATPSFSGGAIEDLRGLEMLQTIQLGFVSRSLMQRIVEKTAIKDREDFRRDTGLEGESSIESYVGFLLGNTKVELIQGTRLMTVSFDHPDPQVATEMVDTFVREYIALEGEQRLASASVNLSYLLQEKKSLEEKLRTSEEQLSTYTRQLGSVSVDSELNIIAGQLIELNSRLTTAKAERLRLESDFEQIAAVRENPDRLLEISSISQLPEIVSLRNQVNALDAELSKLQSRYGTNNPLIMQLRDQRKTLNDTLQSEALRAPQTIELSLRAAKQNELSLERETQAQEQKVIQTKDLAIQSKVLERMIEADKVSFQAVLQKLNEETSQARSQPIFIQVVDPASPAFRVKPKPVQIMAIGVFLALAVSGATILILTYLDTSFKSVDEIETALAIPVLAAIPRFDEDSKKKRENRKLDQEKREVADAYETMPLLKDPFCAASEAYRTLRAGVILLEDEKRTILVTSAVPEEGKSTTAINLGIAMAQHDAKTLLIDADLRKPTISKRMFGNKRSKGLAECLSETAEFEDVVQETHIPNLWVLAAGRTDRESGELLLRRKRMDEILSAARTQFDHIIVDSAPILAVSDTLTMSRHFKVICLVVRSHKTPRRMVKRAIDLLSRARRKVSGTVFSIVPPQDSYYNYAYTDGGRAYGDRDNA